MPRPALWSAIAGCLIGIGIGIAIADARPWSSFSTRSPESAAERAREILADKDPLRRAADLASLFSHLGSDAVPAITAVFEAAPLNRGDVELGLLGSWWAGLDPKSAWQWTQSDWRAEHATVMAAVARAWAHQDPESAIDHASGHRFRGPARMSVAAALAGWEESGRPGMVEYVLAVPDLLIRQRVAESLAERKVATLGAEAALAWAEGLAHDHKVVMVPRVASAIAEAEPSAAAAWAEPRIAAASRPTGLPRRIATRWVKRDPEAAMAWLASLPAGTDRDDGVTESIRTWAQRERMRAVLWIEKLEPARWNEPVRAFYARSMIGTTNPERALEIISQLEDAEFRNYSTVVIARAWLVRDRAAADAWLERADIPADVRDLARMTPHESSRLLEPPCPDVDPWSS